MNLAAYPAAQANPDLGVVVIGLLILAFDVPNPESNTGEFLGHKRHVGRVSVRVNMEPLNRCGRLVPPPGLQVVQIVESGQRLREVDQMQGRVETPANEVDNESGWQRAGAGRQ